MPLVKIEKIKLKILISIIVFNNAILLNNNQVHVNNDNNSGLHYL